MAQTGPEKFQDLLVPKETDFEVAKLSKLPYPFFELERSLGNNLKVVTICTETKDAALDGLSVCEASFAETEPLATQNLARTYRTIINGTPVEHVPEDRPFGETIEWSGFFVYYREDTPVAIGGIYRYLEHVESAWLGRFAVLPQEKGSGLAKVVFDSLAADAQALGASEFLAFTEQENHRAQRFYEKQGMLLSDRTISYEGDEQAIFRRAL